MMKLTSITAKEFLESYVGTSDSPPANPLPDEDLESLDCRVYYWGRRWQDLDYSQFANNRSCFSFMDSDGFRYYAPSIIFACLRLRRNSPWLPDFAWLIELHLSCWSGKDTWSVVLSPADRLLIARGIFTVAQRFKPDDAIELLEIAERWATGQI